MNNFKTFSFIAIFVLGIACQNETKVEQTSKNLFLNNWQAKEFTKPKSVDKKLPLLDSVQFSIHVDYNKKISKVSKYISGINATTYTGDYLTESKLINHVKLMKPGMIRFPGGDASNMYFFDALPNDLPTKALTFDSEWTDFTNGSEDINWRMNTEKYYAFLDSVNSEGIITVNYPYARYGTSKNPVATAASHAANWVRFDNGRTKFWEVGNETYACWEGGFRIDTNLNQDGQPEYVNGKLYGQHFRVFADSMRAAAKDIGVEIYIGAVFADDDFIWDGSGKEITKNWNSLLAPELRKADGSNYADFISVHSYFLNKGENTPNEIINTSKTVTEELQHFIYDKLKQADVAPVPMALTEWNVKGPYQSTQVGALQAASTICKLNEMEFGASSYFALKDYWRGSESDFGIFSNNDPDLQNLEPYPNYYHFYYLSQTLGDEMVENTILPNNDSLLCYTSSYTNGGLGMVIINKAINSQSFELNIENFKTDSYYLYELSNAGNDIWSEKIAINNIENKALPKGGPANFNEIPAWKIKSQNNLQLEIKGLSAIYILAD